MYYTTNKPRHAMQSFHVPSSIIKQKNRTEGIAMQNDQRKKKKKKEISSGAQTQRPHVYP